MAKDRHGKIVRAGSRVRVLSIDPKVLGRLPDEERLCLTKSWQSTTSMNMIKRAETSYGSEMRGTLSRIAQVCRRRRWRFFQTATTNNARSAGGST
jgi:hypothetical protein